MRPVRITPGCAGGDCPAVYTTDRPDQLLVRGYQVDADTLGQVGPLPADEHVVAVPVEVLAEAYRRLEAAGHGRS